MMTAHTPGPWVIEDWHGLTVGPCRVRYGVTAHQKNVAFANARLIAAAPDLLAALKELLNGYTSKKAEQARAAIAKAEGRS